MSDARDIGSQVDGIFNIHCPPEQIRLWEAGLECAGNEDHRGCIDNMTRFLAGGIPDNEHYAAGCAHEELGDSHEALGNHRNAYENYRLALEYLKRLPHEKLTCEKIELTISRLVLNHPELQKPK